MKKRAIVLIPGFKRQERFVALRYLVDAISHYAVSHKVTTSDVDAISKNGYADMTVAPRDMETDPVELRVYETYWSDIVPDRSTETTWHRFVRATRLVGYWGLFAVRPRSFGVPSRARLGLVAAGIGLLLWYLTLAIAVLNLIGTDSPLVPQQVYDFLQFFHVDAGWLGQVLGQIMGFWPIALVLLFLSSNRMEAIANYAEFSKDYLGDEPTEANQMGLRSKLRKRAADQLDVVMADPEIGEVIVVAHSFGGVIAADTLAEFGHELERVHLFTWGTVLGILANQEVRIHVELERLQKAKPSLVRWLDFTIRQDGLATPVPDLTTPSVVEHISLSRPSGRFFRTVKTHDEYYRSQDAIEALVDPCPVTGTATAPAHQTGKQDING